MSLTKVKVNGVEEFLQACEQHKSASQVFALFCGGLDPSTGKSWCPDCVKADPIVQAELPQVVKDGAVLIECNVGDRRSWKDSQNAFRQHKQLRLTAVPTLLLWGTSRRLVEDECANPELVRMIAED